MAKTKIIVDASDGALIQRKFFVKKAVYTDSGLSSSTSNFNGAVNSSQSISGQANSLKTKTSSSPVNKKTNYYLTEAQKKLLRSKAASFAEPGIVPYDVLEDFLFILCTIEEYVLLSYVASVTGVTELDNTSYVREPDLILNCKDLAKIGYLANGLAALTKQLNSETFVQATSASDQNMSAYSTLKTSAAAASIPGAVAAATSIVKFPGVDIFSSVLSQVVSINSAIQGLVSTFSSPGNTATKVAQLTGVISQITSMTTQMSNTLNVSLQQNVTSLFPIADQIKTVVETVDKLSELGEMMKNVSTSNSYPNVKVGDLNTKMKSMFDTVTSVASTLSSLTSAISSLASPGNIGGAASSMLTSAGGLVPSSQLTKEALGQAVPPSVLANNPMMMAASYIGRTFFGEALVPIAAVDQMFSRSIGNYPRSSSGAGTASFKMQNFASMGGSMSISQMITQVVYGVTSVTAGSPLALQITQQALNVASTLGASATAAVEPRRSDNAIPMMIGMATVLANDSGCPFPTSTFSNGWKLAASVGNDLQKSNPSFLQQVQTSA